MAGDIDVRVSNATPRLFPRGLPPQLVRRSRLRCAPVKQASSRNAGARLPLGSHEPDARGSTPRSATTHRTTELAVLRPTTCQDAHAATCAERADKSHQRWEGWGHAAHGDCAEAAVVGVGSG